MPTLNSNKPDSSQEAMKTITEIIATYISWEGPLLPILHRIQKEFGYISQDAIALMAGALKLSQAEVSGVISFYHTFRLKPGGKHTLQICRGEACQAMGSADLEALVKDKLGIDYNQTTRDQLLTLEPVYCLGNCACSPNIRLDDKIYGRANEPKFDALLDRLHNQPLVFGATPTSTTTSEST